MIKFRCSTCEKAIGVDQNFAGRLIKCPSCENATRVPAAAEPPPTIAQVAKPAPVHPSCPSCNTELFNPSDTMCGVCGHVIGQPAAVASSPVAESVITATAVDAAPLASIASPTPVAATASGTGLDQKGYYNVGVSKPSGPTKAGSIGGWFAGVGIGLLAALVWGVIATIFIGPAGQALAWGIGAIVGCIAGLIARNRSIVFCTSTMLGALLCIMFGKLIAATVAMLAVNAVSFAQNISASFMPDTAVSVGVMKQMADEGAFEGDEKTYADLKVESFFDNSHVYESDGYEALNDSCEIEVQMKVQSRLGDMTTEEKTAIAEQMRADHPEWIEHDYHFIAILDSMVANGEIEGETLLTEAELELETIHDSDEEYVMTIADRSLSSGLKSTVSKKYAELSEEQREAAVRECTARHPGWLPDRTKFLAVLEKKLNDGDLPEELQPVAKSIVNEEMKGIYQEEISKMELDEVDALIESAKLKYPLIAGSIDESALLGEVGNTLDETIDWFGNDGTFSNAFMTRFSAMDSIWIMLGLVSAFAIAFTLGQTGKAKQ